MGGQPQVWPKTKNIGGQRLFKYQDYYAFILEDGLYKRAGKHNWPEEKASGELKSPGIGMNTGIYKQVMKDRSKKLVVYNKKKDVFYILRDYDVLAEHAGLDKIKGTTVVVTPIDAYRTIQDSSGLDPKLRKLKSHTRRGPR